MDSQSQQAQAAWLHKRIPRWQQLDKQLRCLQPKKSHDTDQSLALIEHFRGLLRDLALSRRIIPDSRITKYLETLFIKTHEIIYRKPRNLKQSLKQIYLYDTPCIINTIRQQIIASVVLFLVTGFAGWLLVFNFPDLASLFASAKMIDLVQNGQLWTDDLLNIMPSSMLSFSIISNNIAVTLFAFTLGAFYGLGTFYIISLNGLMLGGIFAFTHHYELDKRLFEFVIAHGIVELSVICIAGGLGLRLGEALIRPGEYTRIQAFQVAVTNAATLLAVIIPFLIGAGLIEGFISPNPSYGLPWKIILGLSYAILFWFTLNGKLFSRISKT